ncbi:methyl-accepting chemotaxis protein [Treponema zioleckii]|uniref:methyl-accepting chemotaxis protein n=1 Tax=Treponema zioleckii TaxID=331680 RepID=UPI00168A6ABB|nr:methyl-accepting chemotaxis protein [Treponema zioleckii]
MTRKNSILKQILLPVVVILVCLTVLIIGSVSYTFSSSYTEEICAQNADTASYIAESVTNFMDGAYNITDEVGHNPHIIGMDGNEQAPVLVSAVERNPYIELAYIVNMAGMQTARSSGNCGDRSTRWWFKQMQATKMPFISKSYYSVSTNMPCASIFVPIMSDNELLAYSCSDLKLDYLTSLVGKYTSKSSGKYSFIIDGEGVVVAHPNHHFIEELYNYKTMTHTVSEKNADGSVKKDELNQIVTKEEAFEVDSKLSDAIEMLLSGKSGTAQVDMNGTESFVAWSPVKLKGNSANWGVITVQDTKSAFSVMYRIIRMMLWIAGGALVIAIVIVVLLAKRISNPITKICSIIGENSELLVAGKSEELKKIEISSKDEIGDVAEGFNTFSEKLSETIMQIRVSQDKEHRISAELFEEAQNLVVSAKETAATSQDSSAAVKEIVATMEDTNDLSENISRKIKDVSSVANNTSSDVVDGVAQLDLNVRQLHEIFDANQGTIEGIKILSEKIESIWDIVSLINNVADQAKIIAFNAELEASSAGEAGKSFRIVANEIRRLSDGIIDGTREIKEKITEVQHSSDSLILASESSTAKINEGYENARGLDEKFNNIKKSAEITAKSADDIADIIQQQASASEQILIAIKEIASGVENFTVATDNISTAAENVRKISEDLNNASSEDWHG